MLAFPGLLLGSARSHDSAQPGPAQKQQQASSLSLRPKKPLANLVTFARIPFENAGEVVEDWLDGSTKEERAKKQAQEDREQLLYLKLRTVRTVPINLLNSR